MLRRCAATLRLRTPLRASLTPLRASLRASSVDTTVAERRQQQRRGGRRRRNLRRAPQLYRRSSASRRGGRGARRRSRRCSRTRRSRTTRRRGRPRTMPGPCGAVMNILREKGEPGLTLQQLMQEVEARGYVPDVIKSKSYLKNNILYSALVNKLMKVRPEGSKFKDHWSIRRKGQVRMGRARFGDVRPGRKTKSSRHTHLETPRAAGSAAFGARRTSPPRPRSGRQAPSQARRARARRCARAGSGRSEDLKSAAGQAERAGGSAVGDIDREFSLAVAVGRRAPATGDWPTGRRPPARRAACCFFYKLLDRQNYLSGMNLDDEVAPIPGRPWRTGLYVIENSPR